MSLKRPLLGGNFKKVALSCTAHMSWLKLYTWTSGLGTHLDTHFVVLDKVVIPFGPAL